MRTTAKNNPSTDCLFHICNSSWDLYSSRLLLNLVRLLHLETDISVHRVTKETTGLDFPSLMCSWSVCQVSDTPSCRRNISIMDKREIPEMTDDQWRSRKLWLHCYIRSVWTIGWTARQIKGHSTPMLPWSTCDIKIKRDTELKSCHIIEGLLLVCHEALLFIIGPFSDELNLWIETLKLYHITKLQASYSDGNITSNSVW